MQCLKTIKKIVPDLLIACMVIGLAGSLYLVFDDCTKGTYYASICTREPNCCSGEESVSGVTFEIDGRSIALENTNDFTVSVTSMIHDTNTLRVDVIEPGRRFVLLWADHGKWVENYERSFLIQNLNGANIGFHRVNLNEYQRRCMEREHPDQIPVNR